MTNASLSGPARARPVVLAACSLLALLFVACRFSYPVAALGGPLVRTIVVETADVDAYRDAIDEGSRIMRELGVTPVIRVDPRVIDRENGLLEVHVQIEYPDRATRDAWRARLERDERYRIWVESLEGLRRVLSDRERELGDGTPIRRRRV